MTAPTPPQISAATLTELLGALGTQHPQAPTVAPLITRAAHPTLRREVPAVVTAAVRDARERQTRASGPAPAARGRASTGREPAGRDRPAPIVPPNLSALLGLAGDRSPAGAPD